MNSRRNHRGISPSGTVIVTFRSSQTFTITPAVDYHVADGRSTAHR